MWQAPFLISVFRNLSFHHFLYTDRLQASTEDRVSAIGKDGKLDVFVRKGGCSESLCTLGICIHTVLRAQSLR